MNHNLRRAGAAFETRMEGKITSNVVDFPEHRIARPRTQIIVPPVVGLFQLTGVSDGETSFSQAQNKAYLRRLLKHAVDANLVVEAGLKGCNEIRQFEPYYFRPDDCMLCRGWVNRRLIKLPLADFKFVKVYHAKFPVDADFYNRRVLPNLACKVEFRVCFEGVPLLRMEKSDLYRVHGDGSWTVFRNATDMDAVAHDLLELQGYVSQIRPFGLREAYHRALSAVLKRA